MIQDAVRASEVASFQHVLAASCCLPTPPRFSFGTFPADVALHYYSAMHLPDAGVLVGADFELCDGYTLHHRSRLVLAPELKIHPKHLEAIDPTREAGFAGRPRRHIAGQAAFIMGAGHLIYGHWLVDMLPKLAVLEGAGHELAKLWYPVPHDTPAFALELLRLVGVPASQIVVYGAEEVIRPDVLLMPNLLHNGVRFSPLLRQAVALFKRGLRRGGAWSEAPRTPARIFLARSGRNRRLVNRDRIEAMAQEARFTLVRPENLSLPEQFALFAGAREIIGEYGSAFHTAMFSPPDTVICGLRGDEGHPAFIQSGIGEVLEQPTGYVFGASGTGAGRHDYTVPEEVFAGCLKFAFGVGANLARSRPVADSSAPAEPVAAPCVAPRKAPSGIRRFLPWGPKSAHGAAPPKENLLDGLLEPGADKTKPERMRWPRE